MSTEKKPPLLAWFVLIGGALFLINALPGFIFLFLMKFKQSGFFHFFSLFYLIIALVIILGAIWAMKRSFDKIKNFHVLKKETNMQDSLLTTSTPSEKISTTIWPWLVLIPGGLLLVSTGPGIIMLPIMPLFLAAMSTDSGVTPGYVPLLIIVIGYGLMLGYITLVVLAIKKLRKKEKLN
ncbi:hypothetical protein [Metabacillus endolithicus]|uniref:Uncharacterized protein n=1 Tax=Metabacillus endolithicus TaxID=1535204 RepID=A0ABW5C1X5_9BACI